MPRTVFSCTVVCPQCEQRSRTPLSEARLERVGDEINREATGEMAMPSSFDECRGNEERFGRGVAAVTRDRAVPYAQAQQLANSDATAGVSSAKKEREKKVPSSKYLLAIK